eukprot:CAMPEP_0176412358 /NCGR_PEP_ID=MMETSP0127-20121128/4102_1 /TAXON_ID=938130 /ORGANISM="Platyophrya macrostoma, Strain WH" /LENGTH=172 /DNA_ID=CAMNT_0017792025 /DNA_START=1630 /DNA_END=2148 /DNA_ORIENTATION=-
MAITIADRVTDLDPNSSNQAGFVFIVMSILSTFAGDLLSAIQLVLLIIEILKYFRRLRQKKSEVVPVSPSQAQSIESSTPAIRETRSGEGDSSKELLTQAKEETEAREILQSFNIVSLNVLVKSSEGRRLLGRMKDWLNSTHPLAGPEDSEARNEKKIDTINHISLSPDSNS